MHEKIVRACGSRARRALEGLTGHGGLQDPHLGPVICVLAARLEDGRPERTIKGTLYIHVVVRAVLQDSGGSAIRPENLEYVCNFIW